jgi:hypothetical protein
VLCTRKRSNAAAIGSSAMLLLDQNTRVISWSQFKNEMAAMTLIFPSTSESLRGAKLKSQIKIRDPHFFNCAMEY